MNLDFAINTATSISLLFLLALITMALTVSCKTEVDASFRVDSRCADISCVEQGDLLLHRLSGDTLMYLSENAFGQVLARDKNLGKITVYKKELEYIQNQ
jgi:hypothetical protein